MFSPTNYFTEAEFNNLSPQEKFNRFVKEGNVKYYYEAEAFGAFGGQYKQPWSLEDMEEILPYIDPNVVFDLKNAMFSTNTKTVFRTLILENSDFALKLAQMILDLDQLNYETIKQAIIDVNNWNLGWGNQQFRATLLEMIESHPKVQTRHGLILSLSKITNEDEAVDFFKDLVKQGHVFDENLIVGFQHTYLVPFYSAIAKEQRQLKTQELLASRMRKAEKVLHKEIWSSIFLRRRQRELCSELSTANNYPNLFYLTLKMGLPVETKSGIQFSKQELCAQMAAFLAMADFNHPENLLPRVQNRVNILYKIASELGVDVENQNLSQIALEILAILHYSQKNKE